MHKQMQNSILNIRLFSRSDSFIKFTNMDLNLNIVENKTKKIIEMISFLGYFMKIKRRFFYHSKEGILLIKLRLRSL